MAAARLMVAVFDALLRVGDGGGLVAGDRTGLDRKGSSGRISGDRDRAGVVRRALLSESVTVVAAVAALVKVTVQVLEALDPKIVGVHVNDESVAVDDKLIERVFDMPLKVAVTIAD